IRKQHRVLICNPTIHANKLLTNWFAVPTWKPFSKRFITKPSVDVVLPTCCPVAATKIFLIIPGLNPKSNSR
ncbi:MAG: hypothetical protein LRY50_03120, partial [Geovibrio sp.]|nr:hypothetical protein [Geovibrio sp.]